MSKTVVEPVIQITPPENFDFHNVMFWEPKSKQLVYLKKNGDKTAASLLTKAKDFLIHKCIESISENLFRVKPIKGYNKTTYRITRGDGWWDCNCQGFNKEKKETGQGFCSHCLAVKQHLFIKSK